MSSDQTETNRQAILVNTARLTNCETNIATNATNINITNGNADVLNNRVTQCELNITATNVVVDTNTSNIENNTDDIADINSDITAINTNITTLTNDITTINSDITSINTNITSLSNVNTTVISRLDDAETDIQDLDTRVNFNANSIQEINVNPSTMTNLVTTTQTFSYSNQNSLEPLYFNIDNSVNFSTCNFSVNLSLLKSYRSLIGTNNVQSYDANDFHRFTETITRCKFILQYQNYDADNYSTLQIGYCENLPFELEIEAPFSQAFGSFETHLCNLSGTAHFLNRLPDSFSTPGYIKCKLILQVEHTSVNDDINGIQLLEHLNTLYINKNLQTNTFLSTLSTQAINGSISYATTRNANKTLASWHTNQCSTGFNIDLKLSFEKLLQSASSTTPSADPANNSSTCSSDSFEIEVLRDGIIYYKKTFSDIDINRTVTWDSGMSVNTTEAVMTFDIAQVQISVPNFRSYSNLVDSIPKIVFKKEGGSNRAYDITDYQNIHNVNDWIAWVNTNTELTAEIFLDKYVRYRWENELNWQFVRNGENTWFYIGFPDDAENSLTIADSEGSSEYIVAYIDQRNFQNQISHWELKINNNTFTCPNFNVTDGTNSIHITNNSGYYMYIDVTNHTDQPVITATFESIQRTTAYYNNTTHGTFNAPFNSYINDGFLNTTEDSLLLKLDDVKINDLEVKTLECTYNLTIQGLNIYDNLSGLLRPQLSFQQIDNGAWYQFPWAFNYDETGNKILESSNTEFNINTNMLSSPMFIIDNGTTNKDVRISVIIDLVNFSFPKDGSQLQFLAISNQCVVKFEWPCEVYCQNKRFDPYERFALSGPFFTFMSYNNRIYVKGDSTLLSLQNGDYVTYIETSNNKSDPTNQQNIYFNPFRSIKNFSNNPFS